MREEKISKLQNIARIGNVVTKIIFVLLIIGIVALSIVSIMVNTINIPIKDVRISGDANVEVLVAKEVSPEVIKNIMKKTDIDIEGENGTDELEFIGSEKTDDGYLFKYAGKGSRNIDIHRIKRYIFLPIVEMVLVAINLYFLSGLFKKLSMSGSPFTMEVVDSMKKLGYSYIPWLFITIINSLVGKILVSSKMEYDLNFNMLLPIFVIFILVKVFEYGVDLQEESDDMV